MKNYLVVAFDDANDCYVVEDVVELICEMYEDELKDVRTFEEDFNKVCNKFYSYHKVFEFEGEIKELN